MKQKKLLAAFLAAAMTVACLTQAAIAEPLPQEAETSASDPDSEIVPLAAYDRGTYLGFKWEEQYNGTMEITGYTGNEAEIIIPNTINGKEVTSIRSYAFADNLSIKKITLPKGLQSFWRNPFYGCNNLTDIYVDKGSETYTSIDGVLFTKDEKTIALFPTGRTSYSIPNGVTEIGDYAFYDCLVSKVTVPESVEAIGFGAFMNCSSLSEINVPYGVTEIDQWTFVNCTSLKAVTIPDSLTEIGGGAFQNCRMLSDINLPDGLKNIAGSAFQGCTSLKEISIPDSVTTIGAQAFYDCKALKNVTLSKNITSIQYGTFANCSVLPEIDIPDGVEIIGTNYYGIGAFEGCTALKKAVVPASVTSIINNSFSISSSPNLTIYGYDDSYAETYAKGHSIPFVSFGRVLKGDYDISVSARDEVLSGAVTLNVKQVSSTATSVSYDLTLTDSNGNKVQPKGKVTVKIPIPEGWDESSIYVYYRDTTGKLTNMLPTFSGGYIIFTTNHFSEYLLSTTKLVATTPCDVDGSGEVDELDSVALARYLASWDVSIDQSAADVDGNGDIDELDSVMLARKLAGWNV